MTESVEIDAPAELVWQLLREEASQGEALGQAVALSEIHGRELLIEVRMGVGFTVQHAYRIERLGDRCRISDQLRPLGWRWRLSNVFLFGRGLRPLEAAAAQGLQNLKATAESEESEESEESPSDVPQYPVTVRNARFDGTHPQKSVDAVSHVDNRVSCYVYNVDSGRVYSRVRDGT